MKTPSRLVYLAVLFSASVLSSAMASLVELSGGGTLVALGGAVPPPLAGESEPYVRVSATFDSAAAPREAGADFAVYAAVDGHVEAGGVILPLLDGQLTVLRNETEGWYAYVYRGRTWDGWLVRMHGFSQDPAFVPSLAFPSGALPETDDSRWDIDLDDEGGTWEGYTDGAGVTLQPLAAPSTPTIRRQPVSRTVMVGKSAGFEIKVVEKTVQYQWFKYDMPVLGATEAKLSFKAVTPADAGAYRVRVTGAGGGSVMSAPAVLSVR